MARDMKESSMVEAGGGQDVQAVQWQGGPDGCLRLIDQTRLPVHLEYIDCTSVEQVWEAIKMLRVRGAPAIGIAAAYGVVLGAQGRMTGGTPGPAAALSAADYLATSRPTAVNLFWALDRMRSVIAASGSRATGAVAQPATAGVEPLTPSALTARLLQEAQAIQDEDRSMCRAIGEHGAGLIGTDANLITHCNAGGLATAAWGTALSVMFSCQDQGKQIAVYVDETRPLWQGARLTAWELMQRKIPATIICDSMAAHVMRTRRIDAVIVGADRIAANGDAANKIGTYGLAVLAKHHRVPFYVAAPSSTFDLSLESGEGIPIEERAAEEVTAPQGLQIAPPGAQAYNPAFDVTPADLITALITERGVIQPVNRDNIAHVLGVK
jgi:methylthioribose-1-phosphate isomerase